MFQYTSSFHKKLRSFCYKCFLLLAMPPSLAKLSNSYPAANEHILDLKNVPLRRRGQRMDDRSQRSLSCESSHTEIKHYARTYIHESGIWDFGQCDHMAKLLVQYLAISTIKH